MLSDLDWQMTATNVDPRVLAVCKERNPSASCILVDPTDESFPVDDASVDLLLCFEVPPVVNQAWFFAEAARVLEPGGKLVGTLSTCSRGAAQPSN